MTSLTPAVSVTRSHNPLRAAVFLVLAALGCLTLPMVGRIEIYALVIVMGFCLAVPIWRDWQRGQLDVFESIHLVGLRYFLFFGLGALAVYLNPEDWAYDRYLVDYLPEATLFCLLGYLGMLGGYYGPWYQPRAPSSTEETPIGIWFLAVPAGLGFVGMLAESQMAHYFWLFGAGTAPRFLSSLVQLSPLFHFACAVGWLMFFGGRTTRAQRWFLLAVLAPATTAVGLMSLSDKSMAIVLAGVPLMSLWYARRRIPWGLIVAVVLVTVFIVFPFFNTFRLIDRRIPFLDRIGLTSNTIQNWDSSSYMDQSVGTTVERMALINSVAIVVRDVPRWVPYKKGDSIFLPSLAFFVPAVLWPGKPQFTMGREFGETFKVVHVLDDRTSVAATVPGELYWNFDVPGIILGMAAWGVAMRLLYRRYGEAAGVDPIRRAFHIVLLIQYSHMGGGIAGEWVPLVRTLIMLEAFRWLAHRAGVLGWRQVIPIIPGGRK